MNSVRVKLGSVTTHSHADLLVIQLLGSRGQPYHLLLDPCSAELLAKAVALKISDLVAKATEQRL